MKSKLKLDKEYYLECRISDEKIFYEDEIEIWMTNGDFEFLIYKYNGISKKHKYF